MSTLLYWFRNDLRLLDNPAFTLACAGATRLLPVYCHAPQSASGWGFARTGRHREQWLHANLAALGNDLAALGSGLVELHGAPADVLPGLMRAVGASAIWCETIAAPEEQADVDALRAAGVSVHTVWQSSMLDPAALPFAAQHLPDDFTRFRQAVEKAALLAAPPLPTPPRIPSLPTLPASLCVAPERAAPAALTADARSSFPIISPAFAGGEHAALARVDYYVGGTPAVTYKATRNALNGLDFSTKLSPWLAIGALSARSVLATLQKVEAARGVTEGGHWIWFELMWRDYFRLLHLKYGAQLYRERGLASNPAAAQPNDGALLRWREGRTGEPLVDAGMRELAATGYLSNRMRQIVASYLIHELRGDWRAGAAWFEAQLIDYDVYSNQGNWLYIAGRGTDPRGGRQFNPLKQAREHDPRGKYQQLWSSN